MTDRADRKVSDRPSVKVLALLLAAAQNPEDVPCHLWPGLVRLAEQHRVAPMLYHIVQGSPALLPEADYGLLRRAWQQTAARSLLHDQTAADVRQTLDAAGVPHLWLKGFVLARTIYPHTSFRPMLDLDLLVPYDLREHALHALQEQGFHPPETAGITHPHAGEHGFSKVRHHYVLCGGPLNKVMVEVHYRLMRLETGDHTAQDQTLWEQPVDFQAEQHGFKAPHPANHLIYLCAHAEYQHVTMFLLQHYLDLHLLVKALPVDWGMVMHNANRMGWGTLVKRALCKTEELFQTGIPGDLLSEGWISGAGGQERLPPADSSAGRILFTLRQLPVRDQLHYLRKIVFPSAAYMRIRYGLADDVKLWRWYKQRWQYQVREIMRFIRHR